MNGFQLDTDPQQLRSLLKKSVKFSYIHFIYTDLNMIFLKFIMAGEISGPPKPQQYIPVGSWSVHKFTAS